LANLPAQFDDYVEKMMTNKNHKEKLILEGLHEIANDCCPHLFVKLRNFVGTRRYLVNFFEGLDPDEFDPKDGGFTRYGGLLVTLEDPRISDPHVEVVVEELSGKVREWLVKNFPKDFKKFKKS